jgi:hypothetical protein
MTTPSPTIRRIAQGLVVREASGNNASGRKVATPFGGVIEKLRRPLVALTGSAGVGALLSRALALAGAEVRWLRAVHVKPDGSLECPAEMTHLDKEETAKGEVALIAHLLELLVTFIGESLTLGLLQEVWPKARFNNLGSGKETHEKAQ